MQRRFWNCGHILWGIPGNSSRDLRRTIHGCCLIHVAACSPARLREIPCHCRLQYQSKDAFADVCYVVIPRAGRIEASGLDVSPLILREPHNQAIDIPRSPNQDLHFRRSQNNDHSGISGRPRRHAHVPLHGHRGCFPRRLCPR